MFKQIKLDDLGKRGKVLLNSLWELLNSFFEAILKFFGDLWNNFSAAGKVALILLVFVVFSAVSGLFFVALYTGASEDTMVPDVVGMDFVDAYRIAHENSLDVVVRLRSFTDAPPGTVVSQSLPPGLVVSEGRELELVVAASRNFVRMPSLLGKKLSYALKILSSLKVSPKVIEVFSSVPRDTVLAQYPYKSSKIKGKVVLIVSKGERREAFPLPDLVGKPYTEKLRDGLRQLGVDYEVKYVEKADTDPGIIVSQSVPPGAFYDFSQKLVLQVAR